MTIQYDPTKVSTEQLLRSYRFHANDNGTMTIEAECRRMYLVGAISEELKRRGLSFDQMEG